MGGHESVRQLAHACGQRQVPIDPYSPPVPARQRQRPEHRLRPARGASIDLDQMDRAAEIIQRHVREITRRLLKRPIADCVSGHRPPSDDPTPAERALAVEDHQRPGGRRIDLLPNHVMTLRPASRRRPGSPSIRRAVHSCMRIGLQRPARRPEPRHQRAARWPACAFSSIALLSGMSVRSELR